MVIKYGTEKYIRESMPDATLRLIAYELEETVEAYATTNWSKEKILEL